MTHTNMNTHPHQLAQNHTQLETNNQKKTYLKITLKHIQCKTKKSKQIQIIFKHTQRTKKIKKTQIFTCISTGTHTLT